MTKFSEVVAAAERRSTVRGPRAISRAAKAKGFSLSHGTVSKVLNGTHGNVSDDTVEALAAVLPVSKAKLHEALGVAGSRTYKPPAAANRLTSVQRDLINALIHQIVRPEEGSGDVANAAEKIGTVTPIRAKPSVQESRLPDKTKRKVAETPPKVRESKDDPPKGDA